MATESTSLDMTTVFHARPYCRFIEFIVIKNNLKRKKLYRTKEGSDSLGASFNNRNKVRPQSNLEDKDNPSIFVLVASEFSDPSNETS